MALPAVPFLSWLAAAIGKLLAIALRLNTLLNMAAKVTIAAIVACIVWVVHTFTDWFGDAIQFCIDFIFECGVYVYELFLGEDGFVWYIVDAGIHLVNIGIEALPSIGGVIERYAEPIATVTQLIEKVSCFFPVAEFAWLMSMYLAFKVVIIIGRIIFKIIPGMGG